MIRNFVKAYSLGNQKKKSFTLIEVLIVLAILTSVFSIVLYFLVVGRDSLNIVNTQIRLQQDLRRCLSTMIDELSESSPNYIKDSNDQALNLVQKNQGQGTLECLPTDQQCVYYTVKFKKPLTRGTNGQITSWSDYIIYTLDTNEITRQEIGVDAQPVVLVSGITLLQKTNDDPNALGSDFESLGASRIKISLVAEKESQGRDIKIEIGSIVYLRN